MLPYIISTLPLYTFSSYERSSVELLQFLSHFVWIVVIFLTYFSGHPIYFSPAFSVTWVRLWWLCLVSGHGWQGLDPGPFASKCKYNHAWHGGYLANFPLSLIFCVVMENHGNTVYLLNITFIYGRCHCSIAAVTSAKYECGSTELTAAVTKIEICEIWTNRAWVAPTHSSCWVTPTECKTYGFVM